MGAILGYLSGDGHVFHERETGSYSLRFTNTEEELLSDFEVACRRAFDAEPTRPESGQRDGGVESVHLYGKEYVEAVLDAGMNLETYDRKAFPSGVSGGSRETKAAFVRALADSEGHVDTATGNVRIASASEELLSGAKQLLLEFGVSTQIQTDPREEKRDLHSLAITDADSLEAFAHHVGFTLDRKERALEAVVSDASGDRTILDVVPEVGPILRSIRTDLRLYQSECGLDDATYCNFERGDANISIHRAETVLTRFEERIERAERDRQRLTDDQSWETIAELKDRYHFSQSELAEETSFTQQQVSRKWGDSRQLRDRLAERLQACLDEISAVDPSELERVIRADVKWRRVETVTGVRAEQTDDRTPILRAKLADVLGCDTDEAVEAARTVLDHELSTETWSELDDELDQFGVSYQSLADDLGVAGSTVSRWFSGAVETDRLDDVRAAAVERFSTKLNRVRALVDEIERDSSPRVYDLTVDGTHNFVANGLVVHNSEDRSAMHEALEQQSYHPDEEILLADGRRVEIGEFVDRAMDRRADDVVDGVDCEILSLDDTRIHSVDMETNEVTKRPVDRVSRHEAPDEFVRVAFSNGRSVTVTPDHPMFVDDGGVETVTASSVEEGDFVPAPRVLPNSTASVPLSPTEQAEGEKIVQLPEEMSPNLAEILGFLTAEGHSCAGSAHEIGVSNRDERLLARMDSLFQRVFGIESTDTTNAAGTVTKRWISTELYRWFQSNFPEVMQTARNKRVPAAVLGASTEEVRRYLVGAFAGDGSVESESMALSTASSGLAEDYADALAKLGVATRLHHDPAEDSWKTYVTGDSIPEFVDAVVEPTDDRYQDAVDFAERSERTPRHHDVLPPSAAEEIRDLRRRLGLGLTGQLEPNVDEGFGVRIETVEEQVATLRRRVSNISDRLHEADSLEELRDLVGWSGRQLAERLDSETTSAVHYAENGGYDAERRQSLLDRSVTAVREALDSATTRLAALEDRCELRYYEVTEVETVPNEGEHATEWVYDVTVEPTNTFVSDGVVLHNSISISKAGINATLRSRCSLLGAANPKYGRFDQYEPIGEQIDLEPALISRFDLIFTVTDQPDPDEDARLAEHILTTNYAGELNTQQTEMTNSEVSRQQVEEVQETVAPAVDAELLRKYVAYAKRNCYPRMTDAAREAIRDFYVDLRSKGLDEDSPVPVTARQLEAIVRLAEASARVRLSDEVTAADAERVIEIVRSCLEDIGIDPETGEFDADVVETGTTKSQRDRIKGVKELLRTVDEEYEDEPGAPRDQVMKRADEEGMERSKVEKEIERLREKGDVYTPDGDHIKLV
ncbi:MAG: LAGLIDADG family homing endonuclease [Halobaculum sp.]